MNQHQHKTKSDQKPMTAGSFRQPGLSTRAQIVCYVVAPLALVAALVVGLILYGQPAADTAATVPTPATRSQQAPAEAQTAANPPATASGGTATRQAITTTIRRSATPGADQDLVIPLEEAYASQGQDGGGVTGVAADEQHLSPPAEPTVQPERQPPPTTEEAMADTPAAFPPPTIVPGSETTAMAGEVLTPQGMAALAAAQTSEAEGDTPQGTK